MAFQFEKLKSRVKENQTKLKEVNEGKQFAKGLDSAIEVLEEEEKDKPSSNISQYEEDDNVFGDTKPTGGKDLSKPRPKRIG